MISSTFTTALIGIGSIIGFGLWYAGVFHKITFAKSSFGPFYYVYITGKGPYYNVGKAFGDLNTFAKEIGLTVKQTAGIYYDDPATAPSDQLNWKAGLILDKAQQKIFEKSDKVFMKKYGLGVMKIAKTSSILTVFPNSLPPVTYMVAANRVYPKFKQTEYKLECGSVEIYDFSKEQNTINVHFPQTNQRQFIM